MTTTQLDAPPSLTSLYAKAAVAGALPGAAAELPERTVALDGVTIDHDHLAEYARVCGFRLSNRLPAHYLHVLAFPLSVVLMADRTFPFALPGLVHVANRIEVRRPLPIGATYDLTVTTDDLRPHRSGRQFDVVAEARIGDDVVWTDRSTYLRRGGGRDEDASSVIPELAAPAAEVETARWRVPADTGRRYAAVSGDRNPIHLSALAARAFGFPKAIAHGLWTAARCEAALEGRLPDAATHTVAFGKPLLLPRTVTFATVEHDEGWAFAVRDREGKDHLTGSVR